MSEFRTVSMCWSGMLLTVLAVIHGATSASVQVQNTDLAAVEPNHRHRREVAINGEENRYGLICPSVVCLPMANDCALVEYIVLEYDVYVDGRSVKIRCQSCPYCLDDWPLGRKRRSVYDLLGWSSSSCASLTCPSVSDTCNDVRSTDVLLRDTRCRTCPACYDSTVLRHPH